MIEVIPRDNSDFAFEKAMKAFKKKINNDGFMQELKDRRYFKKASDKAREKRRKQKQIKQQEN